MKIENIIPTNVYNRITGRKRRSVEGVSAASEAFVVMMPSILCSEHRLRLQRDAEARERRRMERVKNV